MFEVARVIGNFDKVSFNHWLYQEWLHWTDEIHMYNDGSFWQRVWNIVIHHAVWSLGFLFGFNKWYCQRMMKCADCYVDITVERWIEARLPGIDWTKYDYDYESDYVGKEKAENERGYGVHKIVSAKVKKK